MSILNHIADMKLAKVLKGLISAQSIGNMEVDVNDIAYHATSVTPGGCFVAIRGFKTDGHQYVSEAVAKGAKVVVVEREMSLPENITQIVVEDTRDALARLSARFFEDPSQDLNLIGITGTNGKTTVVYLLEEMFRTEGWMPGIWSTISARYGTVVQDSQRTTPEAYDLQKFLRGMVDFGVTHAAMEVTSHAVELKRTVGCHFNGGVFTNLSPEHLDFHGDMETYFLAKEKFFRERLMVSEKKNVWAVINIDDPYGRKLCKGLPLKVLRYSLQEPVELQGVITCSDLNGTRMIIHSPAGSFDCSSPMIGKFNMQNVLAATGAALSSGVSVSSIQTTLAQFSGAPGRLMPISNTRGFHVFVDYAHTPNALENVLGALRPLTKGKMIVVFGCGGDRDRLKRPQMGLAVANVADTMIVTSDNPRSEDPEKIMNEIIPGILEAGKKSFETIVDRKQAIARAVEVARPGDCVVVAGKGHERYQEIGTKRIPMDDANLLRELLK